MGEAGASRVLVVAVVAGIGAGKERIRGRVVDRARRGRSGRCIVGGWWGLSGDRGQDRLESDRESV